MEHTLTAREKAIIAAVAALCLFFWFSAILGLPHAISAVSDVAEWFALPIVAVSPYWGAP